MLLHDDPQTLPGRLGAHPSPRTLATALQRIEAMPDADTYAAGNSYLGLVRQASHSHKERAALCRALLKRGHPVEGKDLTQAFRKARNATQNIATSASQ